MNTSMSKRYTVMKSAKAGDVKSDEAAVAVPAQSGKSETSVARAEPGRYGLQAPGRGPPLNSVSQLALCSQSSHSWALVVAVSAQ